MKKYFIFIFTSAILTRIWYSDIFSNYYYSITDVLLAFLIFYGVSWLLWYVGSIILRLFVNGIAILDNQKEPKSFKDYISWIVAGIIFIFLLNLLIRIIN